MATKYKKDHRFTEEEKQWLRDNIEQYTYPQLTKLFNINFGTDLQQSSISDVCLKRMKIKRCNPYKFPKGAKEFNQVPIGYEMWDGVCVWVKVDNKYTEERCIGKSYSGNWKRKSHLVYEKAYGKIPPECMIVFLDKNRRNCELENLYCTTRTINFMMAKNHWYSTDRELTLAALKWCELFYTIKEL